MEIAICYRTGLKGSSLLILILLSVHLMIGQAYPSAQPETTISARSAVVIEKETGRVLYGKNPNLRLVPASTTKLMTALVVVENEKLDRIVRVSRYAASIPPTSLGLKSGEKISIRMLLYGALIKSANDAAVVLAEAVGGSEKRFVQMMNRKALELGLHDTRFVNPNGLPKRGQYTTAHDLAILMKHALDNDVIRQVLSTRVADLTTEDGKHIFVKNTNQLLWTEDALLGGKTGYTRKARHCFVGACKSGDQTIIIAILGATKRENLWDETEKLLDFGEKVLSEETESLVFVSRADYRRTSYKKERLKHESVGDEGPSSPSSRRITKKKSLITKKTKIR